MLSRAIPPPKKANLTPEYEVRLLLKPEIVLNPDHEPTSTVLSAFGMSPTSTLMNVQFLDTDSKDIYAAGWSVRIRKIENKSGIELTYKKRYNISSACIDTELTTANKDGFNADDGKYEAQVEWGILAQTLSISREKKANHLNGMDLPGLSDSRKMLIDAAPDKFDNWKSNKWGTAALEISRPYGPVHAKRCIGTWNDTKLYIEVWPIRTGLDGKISYIVEASFKTASREVAMAERGKLAAYLEEKGWLLARDSLKTQLIMENY